MKKFRKLLSLLLSMLLLVSVSATLVACPEPDPGPDTEPTTCKLTVAAYDTNKGTVTLSPAKEEYALGEKVTISIEAKTGYEIQSVYIGTRNYTDTLRNGSNEFTTTSRDWYADKDTTVTVQFQNEGIWKSEDYKFTLDKGVYDTTKGSMTVNPDRAMYAEDEEVAITITTANGSVVKDFKVNGQSKKAELNFDGNYTYTYALVMTGNTTLQIVFDDDLTRIYNFEPSSNSITAQQRLAEFDALIAREGRVLIDFYGTECYYCNVLQGQFEEHIAALQANNAQAIAADVKIVKVNVSATSYLDASSPNYPIYQRYQRYSNGGLPYVVMVEDDGVEDNDGDVIGVVNGAYSTYAQLLSWLTNPTFEM
ncbi:MAG: thioredoxin family protein [Clostridiales bacterium]|nr:thioredoxin family protein [Clostridiales bacterium]